MVGFVFIVEGISVPLRPVLWSGTEVEGLSWSSVSQHHQTELVVITGNLNAVRYREDIFLPHVVPFLQDHPDMILHVRMRKGSLRQCSLVVRALD